MNKKEEQITDLEFIHTPKLKQIFNKCRIVGLAGVKSSGKTNNLIYLLSELETTKVYFYGVDDITTNYLLKKGFEEISSLTQLVDKKNCLIVIDEFQKLHLNDRRYKEVLSKIIDFAYHNNIYMIFSTPNIREFNTIIGGFIEKWLLKTIYINQCINGSQLKRAVIEYKGRYKLLDHIIIPKDKLLLINDDKEIIIKCKYISEIDNKRLHKEIF
jgi:hypothetical protein